MAGLSSLLGPKYLPSVKWSSGYNALLFWNIHSNDSNARNWHVLDSSPDIIVLGTSPSNLYIPWILFNQMNDSSSINHPTVLGAFDLIIFFKEPSFSFFITLSAALNHGVNGSFWCKLYDASLSFLWTHFEPSPEHCHILLQVVLHPAKTHYEPCFSASLRTSVTNLNPWQISVHMLPLIDTALAHNLSLYK